MKATSNHFWKVWLKSFAATALVVAGVQGAGASAATKASDTTARQLPAEPFLGGLKLADFQEYAPAATVFQFNGNLDGYGLALRIASEDKSEAPGIDPIKTAAIIPGVFGSVAIPMRNFPVAGRWAAVYGELGACSGAADCGKNGSALAELTGSARDKKFLDKLDAVNRTVNRLITYRKDEAVYGNLDYWAKPAEILTRGVGDCEDFAILKMAALIEVGIPAQSMSLVVLQDRSRNVFHAVLSVATQSGTFILDNLSNTVARDGAYRSYVPLYSFSTDRAWIHGARSGSPQIATANGNFAAIAPGEGPLQQ
ncbi:transglutaminase-like cysteine peptidase [Mesorhizobium sp. ANAO-SY3R2]|uniref:transglutaminase-like cysteine peptidase n=1 Tax=Mesorhizobium sp. ANAO-SY3R2 TaxID=3166644 RepID=UPI00366F06BA